MKELNDVLSTVEQDALQDLIEVTATARPDMRRGRRLLQKGCGSDPKTSTHCACAGEPWSAAGPLDMIFRQQFERGHELPTGPTQHIG